MEKTRRRCGAEGMQCERIGEIDERKNKERLERGGGSRSLRVGAVELDGTFLPGAVDPGVVPDLGDGRAPVWVHLETQQEQVERIGGPRALGLADAALDRRRRVREGALPTQQDRQQHAQRPDLGMRCAVRLALQNLGLANVMVPKKR